MIQALKINDLDFTDLTQVDDFDPTAAFSTLTPPPSPMVKYFHNFTLYLNLTKIFLGSTASTANVQFWICFSSTTFDTSLCSFNGGSSTIASGSWKEFKCFQLE